jgi:hypothetical protein
MPPLNAEGVFVPLKEILSLFETHLVKVHDSPTQYYLNTAHVQENRLPLFFGAVKVGRQYVSYHLMPIYLWPELLEGTSGALRKRMQGKSCFNFRKPDPELFGELAILTQRGFERCREAGYLA